MAGPVRIACVQNGDYPEALDARRDGGPETYQGQFDTVAAFERLVDGKASLVIGIGQREARVHRSDGSGTLVTVRRGGPRWVPGWVRERVLAFRILRDVIAFRPTHVVCRLTGVPGNAVLRWTTRHGIPSAGIIATTLRPESRNDRRFCRLANHESVAFVANHLRVATRSLVACGLREPKAIEYDFPGRLSPHHFAPKTLGESPTMLFVGALSEAKGAGDLLDAIPLLRQRGRAWPLTVCGEGPLADRYRAAAADPGMGIRYLGKVPRERVAELVRQTSVAIVPSRPAFAEGLPLALIEALATRTPVVASTHPVFATYFKEGVGLAFFDACSPLGLADSVERLLTDPEGYAELSRATAEAWSEAQTPTLMTALFERLRAEWTN